MLTSIRSAFEKGFMRYLLIGLMGLLVLSFAVWGIGDVIRTGGSRDVARVGSVKIGLQEYQTAYQRETRLLSNRLQRPITPADLAEIGLDRLVLNKLITDALLDSKVADLKLSLSDEQVFERIRNAQVFKGTTGQFDRMRFTEMLRELGFSEAEYINQERKLALRQHLASSVTGLKNAPQTMLDVVNTYRNEKRIVEYVTVTAKEAGAPTVPTPADLTTYYEERKLAFRAPEYRKATVIHATKESLAKAVEISDEDLKSNYERMKPALTTPEKRLFERVTLKTKEIKLFDDVIKTENLTEAQLKYGPFTQAEIIDPQVAKAAFALKSGEISAPLESTFGLIMLRLKEVTPAVTRPFDEVKEQLRTEVYTERFRAKTYEISDKLDKERASGLPLGDIATKINLEKIIVEIDSQGLDRQGSKVKLEEADLVIKEIFNSSVNAEREPLQIKDQGGYIWVEVNAITPTRERPFDEVKTDVTTRYIEEQLRLSITKLAETIVKDVNAGKSLEEASKLKSETTGELTRFSQDRAFSPQALDAVFATQVQNAGHANARDLVDRVVFKVIEIRKVPYDASEASNKELASGLVKTYEDELLTQYIGALRKTYGVSVDEVNFKRAVGAKE